MPDSSEYDLNSTAVQTHLQIYQNILARMANNSSSVKTWCVTVVSAILVLLIEREEPSALPLAAVPVVLFFVLDVYYLSLEKRFRCSYNQFVKELHGGNEGAGVRMFEVLPDSRVVSSIFGSVFSISVLPFYALIFIIFCLVGGWFEFENPTV
ncbi:hypothetical protein [Saccharospirillum sp.]|uniref:hypothetical protein n=1 Tax=Saccharospirillum sp. TaxID=2033801 RepID=UPI0034A07B2A